MNRTSEQVIHDSLQEWNTEQFVELGWNTKAAATVVRDLERAGYRIVGLTGGEAGTATK